MMMHRTRWERVGLLALMVVLMPGCTLFKPTEEVETEEVAEVEEVETAEDATELAGGDGEVVAAATRAEIENYIATRKHVIVDFYATWCPPCKAMHPINDKLAKEYTDVTFVKANVDSSELKGLFVEWGGRGIPAFYFFTKGNASPVHSHSGSMTEGAYKGYIKAHFGL